MSYYGEVLLFCVVRMYVELRVLCCAAVSWCGAAVLLVLHSVYTAASRERVAAETCCCFSFHTEMVTRGTRYSSCCVGCCYVLNMIWSAFRHMRNTERASRICSLSLLTSSQRERPQMKEDYLVQGPWGRLNAGSRKVDLNIFQRMGRGLTGIR